MQVCELVDIRAALCTFFGLLLSTFFFCAIDFSFHMSFDGGADGVKNSSFSILTDAPQEVGESVSEMQPGTLPNMFYH